MTDALQKLESMITERRNGDPETSYVAKLTSKGRAKIAKKLGEEAVETVIAAVEGDHAATVAEAADLLFHLTVLLADVGVTYDEVFAELGRREGVSGIVEKASRPE